MNIYRKVRLLLHLKIKHLLDLRCLLSKRRRHARLCVADGKECDALVCYHEKDSNLVIGIVIPTLESRHRYKCTALELSHQNHNCE